MLTGLDCIENLMVDASAILHLVSLSSYFHLFPSFSASQSGQSIELATCLHIAYRMNAAACVLRRGLG
jgi:hypothetical protein